MDRITAFGTGVPYFSFASKAINHFFPLSPSRLLIRSASGTKTQLSETITRTLMGTLRRNCGAATPWETSITATFSRRLSRAEPRSAQAQKAVRVGPEERLGALAISARSAGNPVSSPTKCFLERGPGHESCDSALRGTCFWSLFCTAFELIQQSRNPGPEAFPV
ncbi:ragulator complex protein LAMTOR3 isoform X2 [Marmota monax]|uniref:ragulator complex protein LAMTOR3 isoform X2 n=1 Tax=Marmota monax TaxID=9995 RepID=UPI0026E9BCF3|nr:ragulator complex protein LAMTOR3 isoform X2 [Marmota monax]